MRVLFAVSSWTSHYFPMVPLGWALRAAGHDVRVACAPSDVDPLTRAGLVPVPVLDSLDLTYRARAGNVLAAYSGDWPYPDAPPDPITGEPADLSGSGLPAWLDNWAANTKEQLGRSVEAGIAYSRVWRPDLIVHDMLCFEAPLIADAVGVPAVLHLWGPTGPEDGLEAVGGDSSGHFGRSTIKQLLAGELGDDMANAICRFERVIDVCPEPVAPRMSGARIPMRFVPYNGPGPLPLDLPTSNKPRVCVVAGRSATLQFGAATNKLPQIVQAATELGLDVLLLAKQEDAEACGELPESVHVRQAPLHLVLSECDAIVHYAGAGVTTTSMVAGVPQLALPLTHNFGVLSRRFDSVGCGLTVLNYEAEVESIKGALGRLVDEPSFALAARELATQATSMPTPAAVVGALEKIAADSESRVAEPALG
jgi:UDP:flavonoid glycosyltransferase YjiC (YdhE family)